MASPIAVVNDAIPRAQFTADGLTAAFTISWPVRNLSDLLVTFGEGDPPDVAFTVVPLDDDAGFVLAFTLPPVAGTLITVVRQQPLERQLSYGQQLEFVAATVNAEQADHVMMMQELRMRLGRAVMLQDSDPASGMTVPSLADRAGKWSAWDTDGNFVGLEGLGQLVFDPTQFAPAGPLSGSDTTVFGQAGIPHSGTLDQLSTWLQATALKLPIVTAQRIGLAGDWDSVAGTGTDDAPTLQKAYDAYSLLYGGALFMLSAAPGKAFFLDGRPRVPSNIRVLFTSPVALGPKAGLDIRGKLAEVVGTAGFYLTADVTVGATTFPLDGTPSGGGAINSFYAAGDPFYITGQLDSAGTPIEEQELVVASATTTSVTTTKPSAYAYKATYPAAAYEAAWASPNKTIVRKVRCAKLASNGAEGSNIVVVTSGTLARIAVGNLVIVEDDRVQSDIRGSGTGRIARETAFVLAIGEGAATNVRLSRRLSRAYLTSANGRLTVITPAEGATIEGASVVFTAVADAAPWPAFQMRWAHNSTIAACQVLNTDLFGSRGNAFRVDLCHECDVVECAAANPKYSAAGEGYGFYFTHSTACDLERCSATGCRHSFIWLGTTDCDARSCRSAACLLSDFDWHGADEVGGTSYDPEITGGSISASTTLAAIALGNSVGLVNPRNCGVQGGAVEHYNSPLSYCVRFEAGATGCFVRGVRFRDVYQGLFHADTAGQAALQSSNCSFSQNTIDTCADWCVYLDGGANGSANKTATGLLIANNNFRNIGKVLYAKQIDKLAILDNNFSGITPDASYTYAFNLQDITGFQAVRNRIDGASRGIKLTTCPAGLVALHALSNQINSTAIDWSGGGCAGLLLVGNVFLGFVPTFGRDNAVAVTEWPRITAWTVPDQTAVKMQPLDASGRVYIFKNQAISPRLGIAYATSPATVSGLTTSGAVGTTTGVLTGTTGTPGNITASPHTDGLIYLENRSGASVDLSVIWDA